ncbi:hypothetical protein PVAP13_3KG266452 [Panicum virgatum]|uniref:Uncharacterized protein n=1 Tax=Panicum virgatum TaxID=38727 RepID=A0A8T0V506_PANVG|nr:hypothetical protein PVAP13_3KG266452 [Panicum virgatum]
MEPGPTAGLSCPGAQKFKAVVAHLRRAKKQVGSVSVMRMTGRAGASSDTPCIHASGSNHTGRYVTYTSSIPTIGCSISILLVKFRPSAAAHQLDHRDKK